MSAKSTKVSRRSIVRSVQAKSYGVALQHLGGPYGIPTGAGKRYGKHRQNIATIMKAKRFNVRHSGIMPSSKSYRGIQSVK